MANHVDKINVTITGGVSGLAVQGFELTVAVNAIPSIVIEALPIERSDPGTKATAPKYSDLVKLYNDLADKARILQTKATIKITIESKESGYCPQVMTLKDWILCDVGLSTVTTYAAPTLTVVFRHRIVELDHYGSIYEIIKNPHMLDQVYLTIGGNNTIDIWDDVYRKFANGTIKYLKVAPLGLGGPTPRFTKVVQQARTQLPQFSPKKYLDCVGGLFLSKSGINKKCLKAAIAEILAPQPFGVTTWVTLLQTVVPVLIAQVVPTYDKDKLVLEPYAPWQKCSYNLDSRKIEGIDVVSMDPDPIYGLASKKNYDRTNYVSGDFTRTEIPINPSEAQNGAYGLYFPPKVLKEPLDKIKGRIEYYAENTIVSSSKRFDYGIWNTGGQIDEQQNKIIDMQREIGNELVAEAVFEGNYKKRCKAAITSMPTFTDKGDSVIYPGRVLTAKDIDSGELFYGYLSRMTIKGTTSGGGSSYYELMTARPADQSKSSYVQEGTKNPCYEY